MKIALISFFFPPDKTVGGYRPASFCQYFPEQSLEVALVTSNEELCHKKEILRKYRLEDPLCTSRPKLRKWGYKTKILVLLELMKLDQVFLFPDVYFTWINKSYKKALRYLKKENISAILATGPPFSSFVLAYRLSKEMQVPLILDYRDPWTGNPFINHPLKWVKKRRKTLEKKIVEHAQMLITVGEEYAEFISKQIDIQKKRFEIIHNGFFDDEELAVQKEKEKDKFTISFFGNFYLIQKPVFQEFLLGLGEMIRKSGLTSEDIVFQYAGNTSRKVIKRMLERAGITEYFADFGFLKKEKLFKKMQKSHILFDIVPEGTEYMIHSKIYEYALNNAHIFVTGKKGAITRFCKRIEQQYTHVETSQERIAEKLHDLFNKWKNNQIKYGCNREKLEEFSRKNLSLKLGKILKERLKKTKEEDE